MFSPLHLGSHPLTSPYPFSPALSRTPPSLLSFGRSLLFSRLASPAPPLLLSESGQSYDGVSCCAFVPHDRQSNPTPYMLLHSTDANALELNELPPCAGGARRSEPAPPLFTYQGDKHSAGEYVALHACRSSPPRFSDRSSAVSWSGSLAVGSGNGTLLLFDVAHQATGPPADRHHASSASPAALSSPPRVERALWSFDSSLFSSSSLLAASLCPSSGCLRLHEPRASPASSGAQPPPQTPAAPKPVQSHDLAAAIASECKSQSRQRKLNIDPKVSGFSLLPRGAADDSVYDAGLFHYSLVTSHPLLDASLLPSQRSSALLAWDLRMLSSPICVGAHEVPGGGPFEGCLQAGSQADERSAATSGFRLAGTRGSGEGALAVLDVNLAGGTAAVNRTLPHFSKPGRWALARGGDMVADVFARDLGGYDEGLRLTRLREGGLREAAAGAGKKRDAGGGVKPGNENDAGGGNGGSGGGLGEDQAGLKHGHEYEITAVAFADDDSMIATGDSFGHVMLHVAS
ncbi:hypothetical protein TeGR_g2629 [Tetraparma gracilis]|uniref:Uncharacterized protein n=1 Tax=Tetraparma gracilis TaxID=2962635 RepID=A0ABQ6MJ24_9STRA|nr:hypothetical protein TeGR_g2629 [Tetraparma gracilis]